jgi:hypothetical protein
MALMKNSEKHKAVVWFDDSAEELCVEFEDPFSWELTDKIMQSEGDPRETHTSFGFDLDTHELLEFRFKI